VFRVEGAKGGRIMVLVAALAMGAIAIIVITACIKGAGISIRINNINVKNEDSNY
jgi:hypothetical protein